MTAGCLPDADFAPLDDLAGHRQRLWESQRDYVMGSSAFLAERHGLAGLPERLEDLAGVPLVDKEDLRASQRAHPPYGAYLASDARAVRRVHRTGGTTGAAMNLALGTADIAQTAIVGARAQRAAGLTPDDVVVHCLNYQLWMGGYTDHAILEEVGATVVPFGVGNPHLLVQVIRDLRVTAISCTPSYPAVLEEVLAEEGIEPRDLGLRLGLFGGEAALDVPGFRARLERTWGFAARNANYGVTDVICNVAGQCAEQDALHFMGMDVILPEVVDPASGASLPWTAGTTGELVMTHLSRVCQPLVRFRTGDIISIVDTEPCSCGRTAPRFRVTGRADDMVVIRGVNVFPTTVAQVVTSDGELSGEYRIRLDGPGPYDRLPLEVERASTATQASADIADRLARAARRDLRVTATVTVVPYGSLPRTEGKTKRVIREG